METLQSVSLWPWFLAAAHSFAATVFFAPRLLRGSAPPGLSVVFYVWSIGGAAVVAVLAGIIENTNAGLLADRSASDIIQMIAVLALFGALVGVVPMISAIKLPASRQKKSDGT